MGIKKTVKSFLGRIRCLKNGIVYAGGVYIGRNVNIVGGSKIRLGKDVCIRPEVDLWACGQFIDIGAGTEIGQRSRISIAHTLTIGEKVLLSPNVYITDCDHAYEDIKIPVIDQGIIKKDYSVSIGDHSYIGINSVIVGNVRIGKHCVIGANSVVTKDIPDYSVAVGSPAKVVKQHNFETHRWERLEI